MEVQKEAFSGLMEYYKLLPKETKRKEIIDELEELISNYSKIFYIKACIMSNKKQDGFPSCFFDFYLPDC